jgi:hypothetical protein
MVLLLLHALRTRKQQRKMHVVQCGPSKGEMRLPADQRLPFKAATRPPLLPQPAHSSPTGVRERREKARESAREARAPSRTRAEKQLPPRWPAPPSPSPSQDPQSRRGFVAGAATTAARGCRFRGRQFSPCCCCCESRDSILRALLAWRRPAGRPSRGQGARIAGERVSYFLALINQSLFLPLRAVLVCAFRCNLALCLMQSLAPCCESGKFGSFRSVCCRWYC